MLKEEYIISKDVMYQLPHWFHLTFLGFPRGSIRQYRDARGGHVREYKESFVYHRDNYNPETNPLKHIVHDSPGLGFTLLAGGMLFCYLLLKKKTRKK